MFLENQFKSKILPQISKKSNPKLPAKVRLSAGLLFFLSISKGKPQKYRSQNMRRTTHEIA
jgi:hypothetical protein